MRKSLLHRGLSLALALVLGLSVLPLSGYAAENGGLCQHHPAHTDDCGYAEFGLCGHLCSNDNGCITVSCVHVHVENCYQAEGLLNCSHACSEKPACYTPITNCLHTAHGGCGHSEDKPCDFAVNGCETCEKEGSLTTIKGTDVSIEGHSFPYTGEEIRPAVTVTVDGTVLTEDTHYTLSYENNIAAGTGAVTVTGKPEGGYEGIVTVHFTIQENFELVQIKETDVTIDGTSFPYTGQPIAPAVTVTVEGETLTEGKDYSVEYANNVQPGTATVTVRGIATASQTLGYTGEVTIVFTITEKEDEIPETSKPEEETPETSEPEEDEKTEPVEYKITKGNGKTWYQNSGKQLSFTIKADADAFTGVLVNGKKVSSSYYTIQNDTTVILKTDFLNKLSVGKYSIAFQFTDGEAEGTFTVSDQYDTTNPTTGDNIGIAVTVMLASLAALAACAWVCRKRTHR